MACYHLHVDQIKRSEGRSSVACAAYRSGEHLYDDYYGEHKDYTRKGGVILSEIHLPPHAPERFQDRETLWNDLEWAESNKKAQLAHSYDIALMNEFTMEENIEIVRRFVEEQFVSRGMIADVCIHAPEKNGGIPNPHFHVMIPIRPLNADGSWGIKEKKIPILDADGNPVIGKNGKPKMQAVSTTDWSSKETLLSIRKAWEEINNELYERKKLPMRIDCRSYGERGIDRIPTLHEGPAVRKMEARGIKTGIGNLNRLIRATNEMMAHLAGLIQWLKDRYQLLTEVIEQSKAPTLLEFLRDYYDERNKAAEVFSYGTQKAQIHNLQEFSQVYSYLSTNNILTPEDLKEALGSFETRFNGIKDRIKMKRAEIRMTEKHLTDLARYQELKEIEKEASSRFWGRKQYRKEHEIELKQFYALKKEMDAFRDPEGKIPVAKWHRTIETLKDDVEMLNAEKESMVPELKMLRKVQRIIDGALEPEIGEDSNQNAGPGPSEKDTKPSIHERLDQKKEMITPTQKKENSRQERNSR